MSLLSPGLEAFSAIARVKTVHGAAKELKLTQTGVTQRIRSLENSVGATLFIRSRRGMVLTHEGEALLRYCQGAIDLEGLALSQIQKVGTDSEVRVSITGPSSILRARLIPQCAPIMKEFRNLFVAFNIHDTDERVNLLKSGAAQIAVLAPEQVAREMDSKFLKPEKYVLVASSKWKGRRLCEILNQEKIIDFDPTDEMSFNYLKSFSLSDEARTCRHFVNNTEVLVDLMKQGLGYGVLTTEFAKPHLDEGSLHLLNQGKVLEVKHALAWYPRPVMAEYFKALIKAMV